MYRDCLMFVRLVKLKIRVLVNRRLVKKVISGVAVGRRPSLIPGVAAEYDIRLGRRGQLFSRRLATTASRVRQGVAGHCLPRVTPPVSSDSESEVESEPSTISPADERRSVRARATSPSTTSPQPTPPRRGSDGVTTTLC
eukprot:COSAG02_NODE_14827_length_1232_cov_1.434245_1_plen_140_part_00